MIFSNNECVTPWEQFDDNGLYQCRSKESYNLCRLAMENTAKKKYKTLLDINIALLEEHRSLEENPRIRNRMERVIDYLEAKKLAPKLTFDTRVPARFR